MKTDRRELCNSLEIATAIESMAAKIITDYNPSAQNEIAIIGLHKHGVPLANRLAKQIQKVTQYLPAVGKLDISMYRDDVGLRSGLPLIQESAIPFAMDGCKVILVDDVLSSGRTIRAALDAINDYGRPASIRLAVLVDRGGQEYPIRADYVGYTISVESSEKVVVELVEFDNLDSVSSKTWQKN